MHLKQQEPFASCLPTHIYPQAAIYIYIYIHTHIYIGVMENQMEATIQGLGFSKGSMPLPLLSDRATLPCCYELQRPKDTIVYYTVYSLYNPLQ